MTRIKANYKIIDTHQSKRKWINTFKKSYKYDAFELYDSLVKRQYDLSRYSQCKGSVELYVDDKLIKVNKFNSIIK
tara:strand:- start:20 stop:247 length:228 start_codon:yes stop_codon:yes gene_type:complete